MKKRILAAAVCASFLISSCTANEKPRPVRTEPTPTPFSADAIFEDPLDTMEDLAAGTEAPTGANLNAMQNLAGIWNLIMEDNERLQLNVSEAEIHPGEGMLDGGQVFQCRFGAGDLFVYVLEGQVVGARMECHTNAWRDNQDEHDWSLLWKTMVQSVNGNWASSKYTDIVSRLSSGFMPAGQEDGTKISEVVSYEGWVYQMVDEDLGYEYIKNVNCWLSSMSGAAGRPLPEEAGAAE